MYWIFDKWLWKWLPIGFYPDLNGKWSGVIEFREESPRPSADITLTIAQTFSTLLVESETEATLGGSMCGALLSDGANRMELRYSYRASFKPKVKDKIAQTGKPANLQDHVGFCVLVVDPKNKNSLIGSYFTDAPLKSSGSIVLHRKPEPA